MSAVSARGSHLAPGPSRSSALQHTGMLQATNQTGAAGHLSSDRQVSDKDTLAAGVENMKCVAKELDQRLDHLSQLNDNLNAIVQRHPGILGWKMERLPAKMDQMYGWTNSTMESAQRVEQRLQFMEDKVMRLEESVSGSLNNLHSGVQQTLQETTLKFFNEFGQQVQEQGARHLANSQQLTHRLDELSAQQSQEIRTSSIDAQQVLKRLEQLTAKVDAKLDDVSDTQQSLKTAAMKIAQQVQQNHEQDSGLYSDIRLKLETQMSQQGEMRTSFDKFREPVHSEISKSRRQQTSDVKLVLDEIARIQKALNVDYVFISNRHSVVSNALAGKSDKGADLDSFSKTDDFDDEEMISTACIRVREFFAQTDPPDVKEGFAQTDPVQFETKQKRKQPPPKAEEAPKKAAATAFTGADKLKKQAKAQSMKRPYNVSDYYHEKGIFQYIAKHRFFENITLLIVLVNAVWIAVDTDLNNADLLLDASPVFIIAENIFCGYFFIELSIRFMAFKRKISCLWDAWFVFDWLLVLLMVAETWVVPLCLYILDVGSSEGLKAMSMLRIFRLVRMARMARMVRLLRAVPELLIIVKGLVFAFRSVSVFFVLWSMIVYVFAVVFRQLTSGQEIGDKHFESVPAAMNTLLLRSVFGDNSEIINEISEIGGWEFWPLIVFFFSLVSVTTMYMLVGILVDVVGTVASSEKEALEVSHIASQLRIELEKNGYKEDCSITSAEFQNIMVLPGILDIVQEAGVDVVVLADMLELICEDVTKKENGAMTFPDLVEIVLSMRGTNPATVKDCKEQIRITKTITKQCMTDMQEELTKEFSKLRNELRNGEFGGDFGGDDDD